MTSSVFAPKKHHAQLFLFSDWADLIVSGMKTKVTGLIRNADKYGNTSKEDLLKKQLKGKIVVHGQSTQFIRSNEPFEYLGAHETVTVV
jgi:hypothetical protein